MKCVCVERCQFRGIVPVGTVLDLTELELAIPNVKRSFKILETKPAAGKPAAQAGEAPKGDDPGKPGSPGPTGIPDNEPLKGADGAPLPPNAQMKPEELTRRLEAAGVRVPAGTSRQQMFAMLQDALQPHTGKG